MKVIQLMQAARRADPKAFGEMPDTRAAKIVRMTLEQIARELDGLQEGDLGFPGFGRFRVKQVKVEKDGAEGSRKRIFFRRASGKAASGDAAPAAKARGAKGKARAAARKGKAGAGAPRKAGPAKARKSARRAAAEE